MRNRIKIVKEDKLGVIYKVTNTVNGKIYIGQAKESKDSYLGSGVIINQAVEKYGRDKFEKEILESCDNSLLNEREIYWIAYYNSTNTKIGYNLTPGGFQKTPEHYHKITEILDDGTELVISDARSLFENNVEHLNSDSYVYLIVDYFEDRVYRVQNLNYFCNKYNIPCSELSVFDTVYCSLILSRWACLRNAVFTTKTQAKDLVTSALELNRIRADENRKRKRALYTVIDHSTKEIWYVDNLRIFCKDRNLHRGEFRQFEKSYKSLLHGKWSCMRGHLSGTADELIDNVNSHLDTKKKNAKLLGHPNAEKFTVIDHKENIVHFVIGLTKFCKDHGFSDGSAYSTLIGKKLVFGRWGIFKGHLEESSENIIRMSLAHFNETYRGRNNTKIEHHRLLNLCTNEEIIITRKQEKDCNNLIGIAYCTLKEKIAKGKEIVGFKYLGTEKLYEANEINNTR